jgi:hypothetical protein
MTSLKRHEGYLMIDNRGLPAIDGIPGDKSFNPVGANQLYECATVTCAHCNVVVILRPDRSRPRNYCRKCDRYICDNPACSVDCFSFDKLLDDMQEQAFLQLQRSK